MLKVGMYVRCPFDTEAERVDESRTFFLGQIAEINYEDSRAKVIFYDFLDLKAYFGGIPSKCTYKFTEIKRTAVLSNSNAIYNGQEVRILSISERPNKNNEFYRYFIEYKNNEKFSVKEVYENELEISLTRADYNPANQLLNYELQSPTWYVYRRIVSKSLNIINNSPSGFKNLLGTRVHLFNHQVDTILRALTDTPCRLMLADEVGLGKTIEALSIIKGIKDRLPDLRALIIVPESLLYQWQIELSYKFWIDAPIWGIDSTENKSIILISTKKLQENYDVLLRLEKFDICVVDETHKLLNNQLLYNKIFNICKSTQNVLLLSATPILHRQEEYYKLLKLLNPERFENMPLVDFNRLLSKQKNIRDIVFNLMRDLPDYIEYDLYYDFIDGLEEINDEINDYKLKEIISQIDVNSNDKGLSNVKLALSYISEFYQIERGIIRHRRAEILEDNIQRELIDLPYEMCGSNIGVYEENCYNSSLDYAEMLCNDKNDIISAKQLLSAVSSSPYAVIELINSNDKFKNATDVMNYALLWKQSVDSEIDRINSVVEDIELFHSKFSRIVDFIDQEDIEHNKKFLIFTSFTATAKKLEKCFKNFFGENSTCSFHYDMSPDKMQYSATLFQNEDSYRFMICDESGGEGRNFQIADYIIHCDLPWSPALLEQRIGRLDRIGREKDKNVTSVVFYSENTIENDLFNIYNLGLNIFKNSLCGMEIAFEQIHNTIEEAMKSDIRFGLSNIVEKIKEFADEMNEEIEKERYFDLARQLDLDLQDKISKLIYHFTNNDGQELMNTMLAWPDLAGFRGVSVTKPYKDNSKVVSIDTSYLNERSMKNTLYLPPTMEEMMKRSKYKNGVKGTFSRTAAVKHEDLAFFAPFNPLFDSITKNAEECYKGRSVAFKYKNCPFEYMGLLFTWNLKYNPYMVYKKGISPDLISMINRYLPIEQIVFAKPYLKKYSNIDVHDIVDYIEKYRDSHIIHLGKRETGAIDRFKKMFKSDDWREYIKYSYNLAIEYARVESKYLIESDNARKELEKNLTAAKARKLFYGYDDGNSLLKTQEEIDALIYGLDNPIIELDSIAFVYFES